MREGNDTVERNPATHTPFTRGNDSFLVLSFSHSRTQPIAHSSALRLPRLMTKNRSHVLFDTWVDTTPPPLAKRESAASSEASASQAVQFF